MEITLFRQPFQFLCRIVLIFQRKGRVPDDLPEFPAGRGLALHLFRLIALSQVIILEGDLLQPNAFRLLNDGVLDLPELLLLGQLFFSLGLSW